jgi:hypothetical protein
LLGERVDELANHQLKKEDIIDNDELEDILFANSEEVCGWYMGDYYEEPTRIVNPQMKALIEQFKFL